MNEETRRKIMEKVQQLMGSIPEKKAPIELLNKQINKLFSKLVDLNIKISMIKEKKPGYEGVIERACQSVMKFPLNISEIEQELLKGFGYVGENPSLDEDTKKFIELLKEVGEINKEIHKSLKHKDEILQEETNIYAICNILLADIVALQEEEQKREEKHAQDEALSKPLLDMEKELIHAANNLKILLEDESLVGKLPKTLVATFGEFANKNVEVLKKALKTKKLIPHSDSIRATSGVLNFFLGYKPTFEEDVLKCINTARKKDANSTNWSHVARLFEQIKEYHSPNDYDDDRPSSSYRPKK